MAIASNARKNSVSRDSGRWIVATLGLSVLVWFAGLAVLLAIANVLHTDIPAALAAKLPLLKLQPELIFAGDSRTNYQVDADLAARLLNKPGGTAVNIAYEAGDPLSLLAAIRSMPNRFEAATLVLTFPPFLFNEGAHGSAFYPESVTARLGLAKQVTTFLPMRVGTLIRYIRETFSSRLASERQISVVGVPPADFGLVRLPTSTNYQWPKDINNHAYYERWDASGVKARLELDALCKMTQLVGRLVVVFPPWAPRYDRAAAPLWRDRDEANVAMTAREGARCGFEVLNFPAIPGLLQQHFFDESHLNGAGVPIYTTYLVKQLER